MHMLNKTIDKKNELVYPELSYKVVGVLFEVYNNLGGSLKEKHYQKALSKALADNNVKFSREFSVPITFKEKEIGRYFLDFLVEEKIVLELKIGHFKKEFFNQLLGYLKQTHHKLGIIAIFGKDSLYFKRVINLEKY